MTINYPTIDDIIFTNSKVLSEVKVKRADAHKVLSREKIRAVLEFSEKHKGDVFDKAVVLLKGLIQKHPFASGNRRTAFLAVQNFLLYNQKQSKIKDGENAYILQGIRENYYSDKELRDWLLKGEIREFKRA